jgi:hypothetical protein
MQVTEEESKNEKAAGRKSAKLNPLQVFGSVFAAVFGVQSSKNRERDFKEGKFSVFIIAGVVFTLLFIATVFTIVQVVLKSAGS